MCCFNTKPVGTDPKTGKQLVEAMIIADTEPETLPTTGEGIIGMSESEVFAPFSLIYVLAEDAKHKIYIAGETGQFIGQ